MSEQHGIVFEWNGETPLTDDTPLPAAASDVVPKWYEDIPLQTDAGPTVKLCGAFSDALRIGWIIPLPFDLTFRHTEGSLSCSLPDSDAEVSVYGPSTADRDKNSSFRKPELKIPNPWKIHTPDGYSTLVTYPRNREDDGIKPYSMLVETDSYDGPINIPASTTQSRGTIPGGVPFIHVIPLKRDAVLSDVDVTDESESPEIKRMWRETHLRTLLENGYYRKYCWVPKKSMGVEDTTVIPKTARDNNDRPFHSLVNASAERPTTPEPTHTTKAFTLDELSGIIPEPFSNAQAVPAWITDPKELPINGDDEDRFRTWAQDVMQLGWNIPQVTGMNIRVEDGEVNLISQFPERFERDHWDWSGEGMTHPAYQTGEKYSSARETVGKLESPWFIFTPPGYSLFVCEPFNHRQQFIRSYTGIVDADRCVVDSNLIGKIDLQDGDYAITAGEPNMTQIPFHRESMLSEACIVTDSEPVKH